MKQILLLILVLTCLFYFKGKAQSKNEDSLSKHSLHFFILNKAKAAYKYDFTDVSSIRFCLDAAGLFKKNIEKNTVIRNDRVDWSEKYQREIVTSRQFYSISSNYIYKLFSKERYNIYGGIGPHIKLEYYQDEYKNDTYESDNSVRSSIDIERNYNWYFGGSVLLGIEVKINGYLSLLAEYEATLTRGWNDNKRDISQTFPVITKNENYFWEYKLNSLQIGFGVYL